MERESFEDEEIGRILSDNFICIKLDREERPDVDKVYMTFVQVCVSLMLKLFIVQSSIVTFCSWNWQATSGGGGWPMSVWLTPELRPFIGGTYFPPTDHGRRPGLKTVLMRIIDQVQKNWTKTFWSYSLTLGPLQESCAASIKLGNNDNNQYLSVAEQSTCFGVQWREDSGSTEERHGHRCWPGGDSSAGPRRCQTLLPSVGKLIWGRVRWLSGSAEVPLTR